MNESKSLSHQRKGRKGTKGTKGTTKSDGEGW